jgi:phenylalanyl-tRNA synthetase alpha subunit
VREWLWVAMALRPRRCSLVSYLALGLEQVEGLIADYNLSLGDLIGVIEEFFRRIGITRLRFKPAFNPYTEPSMEVRSTACIAFA